MSKRARRGRTAAPTGTAGAAGTRCTVTVCRGCCCGTAAKVPHLDHESQLGDLRTALAGVAMVRRTDCLDACERANVVVIQPSAEGRKAGGRPVWLGQVNDHGAAADIASWVDEEAPAWPIRPTSSTSTPSSPHAASAPNSTTNNARSRHL